VIDAPGPWGTGPFRLVEGHSSLDVERAVINREPFACTWLTTEDRTPRVRLVANTDYWDRRRGPRLEEVVFRNDVSFARALELVCETEGEVDIVTEVPPDAAERVERSEHARLVALDSVQVVAGVIDRDADGLPLADRRARQALNLAVDRNALVSDAVFGRGRPLAGLTPPTPLTFLHRFRSRLRPYPHDPRLAAELWSAAGGQGTRPLRMAGPEQVERVVRKVAADLEAAIGIEVEIRILGADELPGAQRRLIEKVVPRQWDVLIQQQGVQSADAPPLELHRAFVGLTGEHRAGPVVPEFERLYADLPRHTSQLGLVKAANRIDRFVRREALALFLYAPQALYAVNRHVDFTPYRTTFELAESEVKEGHWSRR